jgi:hypothetical protein
VFVGHLLTLANSTTVFQSGKAVFGYFSVRKLDESTTFASSIVAGCVAYVKKKDDIDFKGTINPIGGTGMSRLSG